MRPTVENPSGSKNNKRNKLPTAIAAGLALVALTACGEKVTTAEPTSVDTPAATSTADIKPTETAPAETPSPDITITGSPTEIPLPPDTNTTEPVETVANPGPLSFEEHMAKHLTLDRETVQGWIESDDLESIANATALEMLNSSENTSTVWVSKCKTDPVSASISIWKSIDNMTGPELACQSMIGGGLITTATADGKIYPDNSGDTLHDAGRAAVLTDLTLGYWGAKDTANYGKAAHSEFLINSQIPYNDKNSIAMIDYSYTDKAMKVAEGEVEINGKTYRTIDIQMYNIIQDNVNTDDTLVLRNIVAPVTMAWDIPNSDWEKWGGKDGDGSIWIDAEGNPITHDGGPVEVLVPYQTIGTFESK